LDAVFAAGSRGSSKVALHCPLEPPGLQLAPLFKLSGELLALAAEDHPPVLLYHQLQMFDLLRVRTQLLVLLKRLVVLGNQQRLQCLWIKPIKIRQWSGKHGLSMPLLSSECSSKTPINKGESSSSLIRPTPASTFSQACASRCLRAASIAGRETNKQCLRLPAAR